MGFKRTAKSLERIEGKRRNNQQNGRELRRRLAFEVCLRTAREVYVWLGKSEVLLPKGDGSEQVVGISEERESLPLSVKPLQKGRELAACEKLFS